MVTQPAAQPPLEISQPSFFAKAGAALAAALGITLLAALVFSVGVSLAYLGRILPGVRMADLDLGGVRRTEAVSLLNQQISFPTTGQVTLRYGERSWAFSPQELGLQLDAEASAGAAYAFGRSLWPWENVTGKAQSLNGGVELATRLAFDGEAAHQALQQIAAELNQPTIEAQLSVNGLEVHVQPGQVGLTVDTEKTADWLAAQLLLMQDIEVPLAVIEAPPRILDASGQAAIAQNLLSQPLTILPGGNYEGNPEPWTIQPDVLAGMLSIERVESDTGAHYQIGLDSQQLGAFLAGLAPQVAAEARNARFIFNDETRQLDIYKLAVIGRTLNLQASIDHINQQIGQGVRQVELQYDYSDPEISDSVTAAELGITELVHQESTYFYGSAAARIQNITTAAERFHGLLVPPGAVFSMVDNIGDISLESGFAEALIIFGDRTIKGVGGGVCQVSTTLFRAVFFAGFPILERYPHAYRVGYYERNSANQIDPGLVGLDATVFAPIVDFKFQNDTPYWLLMETYVDSGSITWKFYSTSDGRTVQAESSGIDNIIDSPDTRYEENPELSKGEVKQVDWAVNGADVTWWRRVYRDGLLLFEDIFATHYQAWPDIFQYGPGTPNMPPKQVKGQNDN
ncbi:MAG: VanW family protein [Anaerolineales bacterium]